MIAVIFEAWPHEAQYQRYLDLAGELKPLLAEVDGFISIERFQSLSEPAKLLSLSFWRDEEAIGEWRRIELHRTAQSAGRSQQGAKRSSRTITCASLRWCVTTALRTVPRHPSTAGGFTSEALTPAYGPRCFDRSPEAAPCKIAPWLRPPGSVAWKSARRTG